VYVSKQEAIRQLMQNFRDEILSLQAETLCGVKKNVVKRYVIALSKLKRNKAPGIDNITYEMIPHSGETLLDKLFELVRTIWRT
jgi:hypothetical protein